MKFRHFTNGQNGHSTEKHTQRTNTLKPSFLHRAKKNLFNSVEEKSKLTINAWKLTKLIFWRRQKNKPH